MTASRRYSALPRDGKSHPHSSTCSMSHCIKFLEAEAQRHWSAWLPHRCWAGVQICGNSGHHQSHEAVPWLLVPVHSLGGIGRGHSSLPLSSLGNSVLPGGRIKCTCGGIVTLLLPDLIWVGNVSAEPAVNSLLHCLAESRSWCQANRERVSVN